MSKIDNPTSVAIGGTITGGTNGSVLFVNPAGIIAQDNANFFFDNTNNRLGIGTNTPNAPLQVANYIKFDGSTFSSSFGYQALNSNASFYNLGIGEQACYSNTGGLVNTGVGYQALYSNTSGNSNTALGAFAAFSLNGGINNFACGDQSLFACVTGSNNTAIGSLSLYQTTGDKNTAIGESAGYSFVAASNNVCLGYFAGAWETASNSFYVDAYDRSNLANGRSRSLIYGTFNSTATSQTIRFNASATIFTTTANQLSIQYDASNRLDVDVSSAGVVTFNAVGASSRFSFSDPATIATSVTCPLHIGGSGTTQTLTYKTTTGVGAAGADHIFQVGNNGATEAMRIVNAGTVGIGTGATVSAKLHVISTTEQARIGYDTSNYYSTTVASDGVVTLNAVGANSAFVMSDKLTVTDFIFFDQTDSNTRVGYQAGNNLVAGAAFNSYFGYQAGLSSAVSSTDTADSNCGFGSGALKVNQSGSSNTAIGRDSLTALTSGTNNVSVGHTSMGTSNGSFNTSLGFASMYGNAGGSNCIGIGYYAGRYESVSGVLLVDAFDRGTQSASRNSAMFYGVMSATSANQTLQINSRVGLFGAPSAYMTLAAGTASAGTAPLKFKTGTSLTAAEAGAMEFTTDDLYFTITTGTARKGIVLNDGTNLTSGRVPFATTNGRITDDADFTFATDTLTVTKIAATTLTGDQTYADTINLVFNTGTGSKIGTGTTQKIGFWNAAPIAQPTTGIAAATFVANTSGIVNDTATFDGYTLGQVVKALRNSGLLA